MIQANQAIARAAYEAAPHVSDYVTDPHHDDDLADQSQSGGVNVSQTERTVSTIAGVALVALGLPRLVSLRGMVMAGVGAALVYRGLSGHCALYEQLGLNRAGKTDPNAPSADPSTYNSRSIHVEHGVTINRSPEELYTFWRNFENLPRFMEHLKDVKVLDEKRSHWVAKGPMNSNIDWDAQIINDEPNRLIAWQSIGSPDVDNSGSVRFIEAPGGRGTELKVVIDYIPPAGKVGSLIAKLFGEEPELQITEDLRRFKQLMEAGEVTSNADGHPRGTC